METLSSLQVRGTKVPETKNAGSLSAEMPNRLRLMSKAEVLELVPFSYQTLWAWMREGKFPRSREVGGKSCWMEHEVQEWLASRPIKRLKGDEVIIPLSTERAKGSPRALNKKRK
jgi:predicted DNA-binding transcriptional regulator AlpA